MDESVRRWAGSGAMALTGRPGTVPLGPPAPLVDRLLALRPELPVDPLALLGERAALGGLRRRGDVSCGGGTRLLRTLDGSVAVTLARAEDVELLPAWLECDVDADDPWASITAEVAHHAGAGLEARAVLLGLPIGVLPRSVGSDPRSPAGELFEGLALRATEFGPARGVAKPLRVLDLSALWAGPLCTNLLVISGAEVTKVESVHRPDGARRGPAAFFELLNAGKSEVILELRESSGVESLRDLMRGVDVVVESSRPRALEQIGIHAADLLRERDGPSVWLSITGHGRAGDAAFRVAFGDDAAVAGGLVVTDASGPCFCADAIADPLSGIVAAVAVMRAVRSARRWLIDIPMSAVAASFAGPTLDTSDFDGTVAPPTARSVETAASRRS